jgi:hypothetical protein
METDCPVGAGSAIQYCGKRYVLWTEGQGRSRTKSENRGWSSCCYGLLELVLLPYCYCSFNTYSSYCVKEEASSGLAGEYTARKGEKMREVRKMLM